MRKQRFYAHQWGNDHDNWSVCEVPGGGREVPISVISWLTELQAKAIADSLNDIAGYNWHERHADWWEQVKPLRDAEHEAAKKRVIR